MSLSCRKRPALWLVFATLLVVIACGALLAKKPTPPPPPEPTAPVEYHMTYIDDLGFDESIITGINNVPIIVGWFLDYDTAEYHAWGWTEETGTQLMDSLSTLWFDMETGTLVDGWVARVAYDINESNQIVGHALKGDVKRAFLYEDGVGFYLLPRLGDGDYRSARGISESGIVLGYYEQSVSYIWTPQFPDSVFPIGIGFPNGISDGFFLWEKGFQFSNQRELYSYDFTEAGELEFNLDTVVLS